jgi:hypothetical protein
VDIAGAKALKERLGSKAADKDPRAPVDVSEDAPPLFHWTGIPRQSSEATPDKSESELGIGDGASLFRRLGFSFR